jgi:hypothetical protein
VSKVNSLRKDKLRNKYSFYECQLAFQFFIYILEFSCVVVLNFVTLKQRNKVTLSCYLVHVMGA